MFEPALGSFFNYFCWFYFWKPAVSLFWYVLSLTLISSQLDAKFKWGISYFAVSVLWPGCFERWDGAALRDTEKCSDTFSCCRVLSCSANEADIKNTWKEGTEKMLSPLLPLPPWWNLHVNAPSSLTLAARLRGRGTKVVYRDTRHTNLHSTSILSPFMQILFFFPLFIYLTTNLEKETFNERNCARVLMRSTSGTFEISKNRPWVARTRVENVFIWF